MFAVLTIFGACSINCVPKELVGCSRLTYYLFNFWQHLSQSRSFLKRSADKEQRRIEKMVHDINAIDEKTQERLQIDDGMRSKLDKILSLEGGKSTKKWRSQKGYQKSRKWRLNLRIFIRDLVQSAIILVLGFILGKLKLISPKLTKILVNLLLTVFMPALSLLCVSGKLQRRDISPVLFWFSWWLYRNVGMAILWQN